MFFCKFFYNLIKLFNFCFPVFNIGIINFNVILPCSNFISLGL